MTMLPITVPAEQQEGTRMVLRSWLKAPGQMVAADEPVAELETDKVAMEINAPAAGMLAELAAEIGDLVSPGQVIARLKSGNAADAADEVAASAAPERTATDAAVETAAHGRNGALNGHEYRLSPSVRRLVQMHNLDPAQIAGTGRHGRLTREDVLAFVERQRDAPAQARQATAPAAPAARQAEAPVATRGSQGGSRMAPHDSMRRAIAEHMVRSVTTAPHVTAVFEVDLTAIMADRARRRASFQAQGADLTYTAYFIMASVAAMRAVPQVNSRFHEDALEIFDDVNIGIGTALDDKGLIVPVVHKAQELSLLGVAKRLEDIKQRARSNALKPADVQGGTFTISNHGVSGSLVATPIIINQPQSAILGIGKAEKRVVVREIDGSDAMVIRPMAYVSLTIDHRVLDGFQTNKWLSTFVSTLESWSGEGA